MRIYILFLLSISVFTNCTESNETTTPTIAKEIAAEPASTSWLGKWERNEWQNESDMEIKSINKDSIIFSISAISGGHMGDLEGTAVVHKNIATYLNTEGGDTCLIVFTLSGDSVITVDQKQGLCFAGMGVSYSGKYINAKLPSAQEQKETLLSLEIFNTTEQDSLFKNLVGDDYDLFVNSTQLTSESDDLDSLHATVTASGVRGLFTSMENIIMIDKKNMIWAAVIDGDEVLYFTNSSAYKNKLPQTIESWRERFKEYEVVYK
ncbi:MAG: hypothetical protein ACTHJT_11035 [Cytophaga sp.]|uniref:hypothetical protein n=1 Tax=Cytophaga sp. TaxID=29535 RepID=UPI003F7F1CD5